MVSWEAPIWAAMRANAIEAAKGPDEQRGICPECGERLLKKKDGSQVCNFCGWET